MRGFGVLFGIAALAVLGQAGWARAEAPQDLTRLSIEELGNVEITSVSKRSEPAAEAPSAVYVISHDDIIRSGARSVPEILRLATNLEVAQVTASRFIVTARGFNGAPAAQNFSNKLLVLIDGRSVYTPLFSGVYWDMQDVLAEDVERVEVISGPGATLWGVNAVNGVINIITRSSASSQGGLAVLRESGRGRGAALRYGGAVSERLTYRLYAKAAAVGDTRLPDGRSANDHWSKPQAGFRVDWTPGQIDTLTFQGDLYRGAEAQLGAPAERIRGQNLTARWTRAFTPDSALQAQAYYDYVKRDQQVDGSGFDVDTFDLDIQRSLALGRQRLVVGGGYRRVSYHIYGTPSLFWVPDRRDLDLWNAFVQDTVALTPRLKLTAGLKIEDDPFAPTQLLPSLRLAWSPSDELTLWAAVSKAVRAPTPFDREVRERAGIASLNGDPDFKPERLWAYEAGLKMQPTRRTWLSVSAYYNDYQALRSIEPTPPGFFPIHWGNLMAGRTLGVEAWGEAELADWWRIKASATWLEEQFRFRPGASRIIGLSQAANDPKYQASLTSTFLLPRGLTFEAMTRYVSALPQPRVPAYTEMNARLGWDINSRLTVAIYGRNLLHDWHTEYVGGDRIPRTVAAELQWRF